METPLEPEGKDQDLEPAPDQESPSLQSHLDGHPERGDLPPKRNRILLADDDPEFERTLDGLASRLGCPLVVARDFESLRRAMSEFDPDVIVFSLKIKDRDGAELIRYLSEQHWYAQLVLVGDGNLRLLEAVERLARVRRLNIYSSHQKPVPVAGLRSLLQELLSTRAEISTEEVRTGLERDEFVPFFQPMIDLSGEKGIVGAEVLARWNHPFHGMLPASEFIDIAEESGMAADLTTSLLEKALVPASAWVDAGQPLGLSLNVSAMSLTDLRLPDILAEIVARHELENSMVTIELTESSMTEREPEILDNLTRLRMKGFHLSMDDFGTGYSTLLQLIRLPFDEIKIDERFVQDLGSRREADIVIGSTVALAHGLGMRVCAEGVEDPRILDYLRLAGCDAAQGRWIQEPVSAENFAVYLQKAPAARTPVQSEDTDENQHRHAVDPPSSGFRSSAM